MQVSQSPFVDELDHILEESQPREEQKLEDETPKSFQKTTLVSPEESTEQHIMTFRGSKEKTGD